MVTTPSPVSALTVCGQTLTAVSDVINANLVPYAAGYRFRITDPINPLNTQMIDRPIRDFRMSLITAFTVQFGRSYNVEVAIKNTDGLYLPFGNTCSVNTPVFPTTSLQDAQCDNYAVPATSSTLYAISYPGAIAYVFQVSGGGLVSPLEVTKSTRTFTLNDFPGLAPATTYNVKVRLVFNVADPAGPFGKTCTIVTPGLSRQAAGKAFAATVYPNPFADSFSIAVTSSQDQDINVKVYDMTGRFLEGMVVKAGVELLQMGSRYPAGVYNVMVTQGENTKSLRVIKR
jgi:hypothetical protein